LLTKKEIVNLLKAQKENLMKMGVSQIGLFGSFVSEKATPESDIDILIDFETEKETFDNLLNVSEYLEKLFQNRKIDIVSKKGLSPFIGKYILNEVEYV
jgi:uncharacterized protein